jgi:hypothetical protein
MTTQPPPNQDEQHLQLLSIFHYVLAGMMALFGCFPIIHLTIGLFFLLAPPEAFSTPDTPEPPMRLFGVMFTILPAFMILFAWTTAILVLWGGRCIARRKYHTFCLIVAGICCMFMPFGTVLGVFSIIVLIRPSVKALFENEDIGQPLAGKGKP